MPRPRNARHEPMQSSSQLRPRCALRLDLRIHLIDQMTILLRRLRPFEFQPANLLASRSLTHTNGTSLRRRQQLIVDTERLGQQPHRLDVLVAIKLGFPANLLHLLQDRRAHLRFLRRGLQRLEICGIDLPAYELTQETGEDVGLEAEDGHEAGLGAVAVDVALRQPQQVAQIHVLDPLWGDVFALGELEDVLHAVDDGKAA